MIQLSEDITLDSILNKEGKILLYIGASWCGPCKKLKPQIINIQSKYPNVSFYAADVDVNEALCQDNRIKVASVPMTIIIDNQKITNEIVGNDFDGIQRILNTL